MAGSETRKSLPTGIETVGGGRPEVAPRYFRPRLDWKTEMEQDPAHIAEGDEVVGMPGQSSRWCGGKQKQPTKFQRWRAKIRTGGRITFEAESQAL